MTTRRALLAGAGATLLSEASSAHEVLRPDSTKAHTSILQRAIANSTGVVTLGAGTFRVDRLQISEPIEIVGVVGQTRLVTRDDMLLDVSSNNVRIKGVSFETDQPKCKLLVGRRCANLVVEDCTFAGGDYGVWLEQCGGRASHNSFRRQASTAFFSSDATGLLIDGNVVEDIENNGIQVWRSELGEDGTQVINNRISRIATKAGGDGQNGNGVNVFRAGSVIVANNRISDVAYTGVRNNSGSNVQILGNSISRTGEVSIFVEFGYEGAVVSNNICEDVALGISITNLDTGGRLAVCNGNVVRRVRGGPDRKITIGTGINAEADVVISNNVIEDAVDFGITLGWGRFGRNLVVEGNLVRGCGVGIGVSVVEGIGRMHVADNMIEGSKTAAIQGFDHYDAVTQELLGEDAVLPPHLTLANNSIL